MKNSIKDIKNELASIENRADQMGERIRDIKDRNLEITQRGKETLEQKKKYERTLQDLTDSIKKSNIKVIGILEEREEGRESLFKELKRTSQTTERARSSNTRSKQNT